MITTAVHPISSLVNLMQRKKTGENGGTRHLLGFLVHWKKMLIKSRYCAKKQKEEQLLPEEYYHFLCSYPLSCGYEKPVLLNLSSCLLPICNFKITEAALLIHEEIKGAIGPISCLHRLNLGNNEMAIHLSIWIL